MRKRQVRAILELGFGSGRRALRMVRAAGLSIPASEVRYTGIDLFEARAATEGPGMSLKMAHSLLRPTEARVRLLPGDPLAALSRAANTLSSTDVAVISAGHNPDLLASAWFYFPRMLHDRSMVFLENVCPNGGVTIRQLSLGEVNRLAAAALLRRAA